MKDGSNRTAFSPARRTFLRRSVQGALALGAFPRAARAACEFTTFPPLGAPDGNGVALPDGFSSRIVATSGEAPVVSSSYVWPIYPDGGATFATGDGGWIYVANSEVVAGGSVGALRFAADGTLVDAYSILTGTDRNCAGGPTPWGTWLSCEEHSNGRVWECDPFTPFSQGVVRPAMGTFNHEACAVDPVHQHVYLTEDAFDGYLYRFTPTAYPDLSAGTLEAAEILDPQQQGPIRVGHVRPLAWHPAASSLASEFSRGEGCWYEGGSVYVATTGDGRVYRVDTGAQTIEVIYERVSSPDPELGPVDNVYAAPNGDVFVAEDGGDLQIVALTAAGGVEPIVQVHGQPSSEITGPCLSPDGTRLYFSSQRETGPHGDVGITYEVTGPFLSPGGPFAVNCLPNVPTLGGFGTVFAASALLWAGLHSLRTRRVPDEPSREGRRA